MRLLLSLFAFSATQTPAPKPIAIVHATILTMAGSPISDGTIVIEGTRITRIGPSVAVPPGATVIDATGQFVIPGLWDMHVHTAVPGGEPMLGLYVAGGVTAVRDMGGDFAMIQDWRRRIRAGALSGPRIIASGPYIQGGDAALPHLVVRTPAEARTAVDSLAKLGVDFIKVHEMVPPDAFFALARAARTRGITLAGHINAGVTVEQAADSGQKSLEHLNGFLNPCTPGDSVRLSAAHALVRYMLSECGSGDQSAVYRHMAASRTWVTPTLMALEMAAALPGPPPADSLARYEPTFLREAMAAALELPSDMPANSRELGYALYGKRLQVVKALQQSGVHLLAGTDAPLPNSIPGFGLHTELEAMVRAGLTPLEALRTATVEPAHYFAADTLGLCGGCVADLVLLTADPLKDIRSTTRIARVVANGRVYTKADLASLREQALKAAQ